MDFQIVMELSAVATIIGVIVSYFTFHKTSKLSYITQERKEWRADIRKIVDELEVCPFSKKKRVLTKLKTRINTYGKLKEDVGKDSHIWKQIEIIENCRAKEYEKQKDKLILFLSLLLKDDWERAKKEVIGEPAKGIITVCLSFAIIFSWIGIFSSKWNKHKRCQGSTKRYYLYEPWDDLNYYGGDRLFFDDKCVETTL